MWLFEDILNEKGEFHPTFAKFVDGSNMDAIPELAENIISNESAAFVDIIHTNGAFEPVEDCNNQIESCTDVAAYIIELY